MTSARPWILFLYVELLAGCAETKAPTPVPVVARPDAKPALAALAPVAAEARAGLGEGLAGRLDFAPAVFDDGRVVGVAPVGWKDEAGVLAPPADKEIGYMTSFAVGSSCDGTCAAKDWPAVFARLDVGPRGGADYSIVKDEALEDGRVVVARSVDRTYLVAARWKIGAPRYFYCRATLDPELRDALPAFEKACKNLQVLSWE